MGRWLILPNSRNVILGEVRFSIDFRHSKEAEVDRLEAEFSSEAKSIARNCGVSLDSLACLESRRSPLT